MRSKYHGLFSIVVLIVGLISAGLYQHLGFDSMMSGQKRLPVKKVPEIKLPSPEIIKKISHLERRMADLARVDKGEADPLDLSLFGVRGEKDKREQGKGKGTSPLSVVKRYQLSLAFYAKKKRFCIIDGALLKEGDVMEDGTKLIAIRSDRVLIKTMMGEKWIDITPHAKEKEKNQEANAQ